MCCICLNILIILCHGRFPVIAGTLSITVTECRRTWQEPMFLYDIFKICCQLLRLCLCKPHRAPPWTPLPDSLVILSTLLVCPSLEKILRVPMLLSVPGKVFAHILLGRIEPLAYSAVKKTGAVWIHIRTFNNGCHLLGTIRLTYHYTPLSSI